MKCSRGKVLSRKIRWPETEHIGVDDRLGSKPSTEGIPQDSPDSRTGTTVGLNSRRMVMGFHLEGDAVLIIEGHDPCIVFKYRQAEGSLLLFHQFLCRTGNRVLEKVFENDLLSTRPLMLDPGGQGLMATMLAPGLRQGLQLNIGSRTPHASEMIPNSTHLIEVQRQLALDTQRHQRIVIKPRELNLSKRELIRSRH